MLLWISRRLVAAATCLAAFALLGTVGTAAGPCLMQHTQVWLSWTDLIGIALPAAVGGALFFPVDGRRLESKAGFAGQAMVATALGAAVQRVLLVETGTNPPSDGTLWHAMASSVGALVGFISHPSLSVFVPWTNAILYRGVDTSLIAEALVVAAAGGVAAAVHPALVRAWRCDPQALGSGQARNIAGEIDDA